MPKTREEHHEERSADLWFETLRKANDRREFEERAVKLHREGLPNAVIATRLASLLDVSHRRARELVAEVLERRGLQRVDNHAGTLSAAYLKPDKRRRKA